jgi:hypothetical protein
MAQCPTFTHKPPSERLRTRRLGRRPLGFLVIYSRDITRNIPAYLDIFPHSLYAVYRLMNERFSLKGNYVTLTIHHRRIAGTTTQGLRIPQRLRHLGHLQPSRDRSVRNLGRQQRGIDRLGLLRRTYRLIPHQHPPRNRHAGRPRLRQRRILGVIRLMMTLAHIWAGVKAGRF